MQPGHLNPARLPLGTKVGPWRVLERRGLGAYGAVYRAVGDEGLSGPVALKLALYPEDARFAREVELLSRIHHPGIPRLVDHGVWEQREGLCYPYLAMELVEGVSLYDWSQEQRPSSRQVLQVLASLARALEATHSAGGVHRDVKGGNVLVSDTDGRVFLTDFGSGHYLGAAPLTEPPFPPGTPPYRSPEAWASMRPPNRRPTVAYAPTPADDVFALGVTAWRLVTGEYPFLKEGAGFPSVREFNARCCPELGTLTSRMLSVSPAARRSAREMAEALEQAAREAGSEADAPLFAQEPIQSVAARSTFQHSWHRAVARPSGSWIVAASMGIAFALGAGWMLSTPRKAQSPTAEDPRDGGTTAVGDSASTALVPLTQPSQASPSLTEDLPPPTFPGQTRPNAEGRCPRSLILINGACWKKIAVDAKDCPDGDIVYKGACYTPAYRPARPPPSMDAGTP